MEGGGTSRFTESLIVRRNCELLPAQLLQPFPRGRFRWPGTPCVVVCPKKVTRLWGLIPDNVSTLNDTAHLVSLDDWFRDSACSWPCLFGPSCNTMANPGRRNATRNSLERCNSGIGKIHLVDIEQMIIHLDAPLHISFRHQTIDTKFLGLP